MPAWNPQANDLFLKVLDLQSPDERRAYLDRACGGQPELRDHVEALLWASERAGGFLEQPPPDLVATVDCQPGLPVDRAEGQTQSTPPPPLTEGPGSRIGPYKLLQQIGEGGMGVVYMAEQEGPVHRKV